MCLKTLRTKLLLIFTQDSSFYILLFEDTTSMKDKITKNLLKIFCFIHYTISDLSQFIYATIIKASRHLLATVKQDWMKNLKINLFQSLWMRFSVLMTKFLITEQNNLSVIKSLINKLQDKEITVLNAGPKFDILEKTSSEKWLKEEIDNFCHDFQSEINQNEFVKATISPVAGKIIRRFFYPSHYFKYSSFFNFYKKKKNDTALFHLYF